MRIQNSIFERSDLVQMEALRHRMVRNNVLTSNIANAETPGFLALGYDFEKQLQELAAPTGALKLKANDPKHLLNGFTKASGEMKADVYVRPQESIGNDGNTVDVDKEMSQMAENQILYRATIEMLNRKIGLLRYAIQGGR